MIKGLDEFEDLAQAVKDAMQYIESIDGKQTSGNEFVPDGQIYETDEEAIFAAMNPDADRAIRHEIYEFDRRIQQ